MGLGTKGREYDSKSGRRQVVNSKTCDCRRKR